MMELATAERIPSHIPIDQKANFYRAAKHAQKRLAALFPPDED